MNLALYLLLTLTCLFCLLSCKEEDKTINIVGLWQCSSIYVGTTKGNTTRVNDEFLNHKYLFAQVNSDGTIREVICRYNYDNYLDSIATKDGTYTFDGNIITTIFSGKSDSYKLEDEGIVSIYKKYKDYDNAYYEYRFFERRYDYEIFDDTLRYYISIPETRCINIEKTLFGCYQRDGVEEYYWFLNDGFFKLTTAVYDNNNNRTLIEETGTYSLSTDKKLLTINVGDISTNYSITFTEQGIKIKDVDFVFTIYPVKEDTI